MTTADYLEQLEQDREDLVDNLETKGITGLTGDETFTELVPEVLNIPSGGDPSEYFNTEPTITSDNDVANFVQTNFIKKTPTLTIPNNITSLSYLFARYSDSPYTLNVIPKIISGSNIVNIISMFSYIKKPVVYDLTGINTTNIQDLSSMFDNSNVSNLDLSQLGKLGAGVQYGSFRFERMFYQATWTGDLVIDLDTDNTTIQTGSFSNMFYQAGSSDVNNPARIVFGNNFNKFKPTNISGMFYFLKSATTIVNLNKLDISRCTDMNGMFQWYSGTTLDLSGLGTCPCTNFNNMFNYASNLTEINLSNLNSTANSYQTGVMFYSKNLQKIDMRSFDFTKTSNYSSMFGSGSNIVPDSCLIIVADQTQKDWFANKFSRFTNVQTVAEYEASLNS